MYKKTLKLVKYPKKTLKSVRNKGDWFCSSANHSPFYEWTRLDNYCTNLHIIQHLGFTLRTSSLLQWTHFTFSDLPPAGCKSQKRIMEITLPDGQVRLGDYTSKQSKYHRTLYYQIDERLITLHAVQTFEYSFFWQNWFNWTKGKLEPDSKDRQFFLIYGVKPTRSIHYISRKSVRTHRTLFCFYWNLTHDKYSSPVQ